MIDPKKLIQKQEERKKKNLPVQFSIRVEINDCEWLNEKSKQLKIPRAKLVQSIISEYVSSQRKGSK